jgi:pimeloyl-ACP methyl ester carboxylesterase
MATLHDDADMAAQLERTLLGAYCGSADLGEAISVSARVAPGDYAQWYEEWAHVAEVALAAGEAAAASGHELMAARGYLRSAEYWRQAYFFLRHDVADHRVHAGYERQRDAFRKAARFLPFGVDPVSIPFDGAAMPGYAYRAVPGHQRPTVLFTGGFDGTAEELYKYGVTAALEAGWNVVAWDGPGQGGMLVERGVTMRPDFETVLTAVVDWTLQQRDFADPRRLMLVGRSLGGYLAPRGASGEPRIAALVCDPGQFDFVSRFRSMFSDEDWQKVVDADPGMDANLEGFLAKPRDREFYGSRMAAMGATTFGGWLRTLAGYTLAGRAENIACPTLVTEGEGDFASQSHTLFDALTCPRQCHEFTAAEGGGGHCEGMGQMLWQQAAFIWLSETIGTGQAGNSGA